ncbi:MAG TPA: DUF4238 domain-containing protein [Pyrinomonadaceae bacterium]|nr:DUF4238 domain-containing protein [Pyrinomonadaceae bacterium]
MSGKRQHILPRFLQKGFASRIQDEKIFTYVYRKGGTHFETTLENVGLENYFYGKAGETSADEEITKIEGGYSQLTNALRCEPDGTRVADLRVADFVAHLTIRTKQLREFFRESGEYLLDEITAYLSSPEHMRRLLLSNPELMRHELTKNLEGIAVPKAYKDFLIQLVEENAQEIVNLYMSDLQDTIEALTAQMRSMLPKAVKDGHIKTLAEHPAPEPRAEEYRSLNWFIRETSKPLVLGDIGCLFETGGARRYKPLNDKGDKLLNIYLPLSSTKLLLGTAYSAPSLVDVGQINKATAKCSYEYFISGGSGSNNDSLMASIGEWAGILTTEEREQLRKEIFQDLDRGPSMV